MNKTMNKTLLVGVGRRIVAATDSSAIAENIERQLYAEHGGDAQVWTCRAEDTTYATSTVRRHVAAGRKNGTHD